MGDHEEGLRPAEHAPEGLLKGPGGKGCKGLIQDDKVCLLEECPCHIEAALLPVGELPACLPHHLQDACGHPCKEVAEPELQADGLCL